jgi:steroid 5-alpha reductase family enzyme
MLMALFFNLVNGSLLGYYLGTLQTVYTATRISDIRFIAGILLFFTGMILNVLSDETLILMRKDNPEGYRIPRGGLFSLVSCPNFFGEIIEWLGYAVLCWSLPALSFFIWTCCNLIPRALDHHRWYRQVFPDYPVKRKAVFPWLL